MAARLSPEVSSNLGKNSEDGVLSCMGKFLLIRYSEVSRENNSLMFPVKLSRENS